MAKAGTAKTKLVGGIRVDAQTGLPTAQSTDTQQQNLMTLQGLTQDVTPAQVPPQPPATLSPLDSELRGLALTVPQVLSQRRQQSEQAEASSFEDFMRAQLEAPTESGIRERVYTERGVADLDMQATELANQLTAEQERLRKEIEAIETAPGIATASDRARAVAETARTSRRAQADIAITLLATQGRLDSAKKYADNAVQEELEQGQKIVDYYRTAYERNKTLFDRDEQREFELAIKDRERQEEMKAYEYKARLDQKIKQSDPLYGLEVRIKSAQARQAELTVEALENPSPTVVNEKVIERIDKLGAGKEKLVDAVNTVSQLERIKELVQNNSATTLSNPLTAEGRLFQRLATDVADKLARERTGAVVTQEEQDNFKRILGLSFGSRLLSDTDTLASEIERYTNKHRQVTALYDPTGEIQTFLSNQVPDVETYLDTVEQEINDPIKDYIDSLTQPL